MQELRGLFGHDVQEATSLGSSLADWRERLSPDTRRHVFSGTAQAMLDIVLTPPAGDLQTLEALAHAVLGLRINDWDDGKAPLFLERVRTAKTEVETYQARGEKRVDMRAEPDMQDDYFISYIDAAGQKQQKAFERIEVSPRAKLLRNEIDDALETMGGALSREEKRQVLVEALQALL